MSSLLKSTPDVLQEETAIFGEQDDHMKDEICTAVQAHEKISVENLRLRKRSILKESTLNVELEKPLITMRPNTSLLITDIPGLNEAGTCEMYLKYVKDSWDTYDCAIVVMDALHGVNTEDQVNLLNFVKKNLKESKDISVIVLCNKVDDADDKDLMELVDEVCCEIERIFDVKDRKKALSTMLQQNAGKEKGPIEESYRVNC